MQTHVLLISSYNKHGLHFLKNIKRISIQNTKYMKNLKYNLLYNLEK
jgi:hypothetical protein